MSRAAVRSRRSGRGRKSGIKLVANALWVVAVVLTFVAWSTHNSGLLGFAAFLLVVGFLIDWSAR
jgi:glucose uptake protein GlcU